VIVALLLAPTAVGAQSGLLGSVLGNLPIVGPLVNNLLLRARRQPAVNRSPAARRQR
jgi:hypothetical protein